MQTFDDSHAVSTGGTPVSRQGPRANGATGDIPAATLVYLTPIGEFIHSADGKSGTILAVLGIMFTLLARFGGWLEMTLRGESRMLATVTIILLVGFAASALGAVIQAFRTISPRFPKATPSLAFFGDIARTGAEAYHARATSLSAEEALAERMKYNHTGSRIILMKQAQLWWALRYFEAAAVSWLLLAAVLACRVFLT
jgi:hypothetical protein